MCSKILTNKITSSICPGNLKCEETPMVGQPDRCKPYPISLKVFIHCAPGEQEFGVREKVCKAEPFLLYLISEAAHWLQNQGHVRWIHLILSLLPDVSGLVSNCTCYPPNAQTVPIPPLR